MRKVAIAGVGLTKVSEHWELSLKDLFAEAAFKAIEDSGIENIDTLYVANMGSAPLQRQLHLGAMMADTLGLKTASSLSIEAASASGGFAFHEGIKAIASGFSDCALIVGVEKMSDGLPEQVTSMLMMSEDQEYTSYTGISKVGLNALIHRHYMEIYNVDPRDIAMFAVRSHENAVGCTHAQYPFRVSIDRIMSSPLEADPIHILECSSAGDGAAAVVLTPDDNSNNKITIEGSATAVGPYYLAGRKDITTLDAVQIAARKAYKHARVKPEEIDVLEVHDDTTIMGVLSIENLGFTQKGKGIEKIVNGDMKRDGEIPTNTFGGLKARGNPIGATGVYQIVEISMQLMDKAGHCQVKDADIGMASSIGGLGSSCAVTILRRN